jgi:Uma2 family endonuclease
VDLNSGGVEVSREPAPTGYRDVRVLSRGGSIVPLAFPDLTIDVADVLG